MTEIRDKPLLHLQKTSLCHIQQACIVRQGVLHLRNTVQFVLCVVHILFALNVQSIISLTIIFISFFFESIFVTLRL